YLAATDGAALGWLVDFVSSARQDYHRAAGPRNDDECLTIEAALVPLTERALRAIETAADNEALWMHNDLLGILFRLPDFSGDPQVVRDWVAAQFLNDDTLVTLAYRMTGQSWSVGGGGFGSLSDRVSKSTTSAQIDGIEEILDTDAFKSALERIDRDAKLDTESLTKVRTFLKAWEHKTRKSKEKRRPVS